MEEKDYATCDVVKILKDKGYKNFISKTLSGDYNRAALYDIQKWLREKYDINIVVDFDSSQLWGWSLYECNLNDKYIDNNSMFNSYEEALNNGILNALKLI